MEITPLGDSALIVRVRDRFDDAPDETLNDVLRTLQRLENAAIPGLIEFAPAYTSVAVFFDPVRIVQSGAKPGEIADWLTKRIVAAIGGRGGRGKKAGRTRVMEIPVCYEAEFGLDLDQVARHAQISAEEVVELHSAADYRVACIGFTPGFAFLAGLPKNLATPRRGTPRKQIHPGSVAIGGAQTGIYPIRSPGGWNIIGRTPLRLFDPAKDPPTFFRAGDQVRFRAITRDEFDAISR